MLSAKREMIAEEIAIGTGADIAVRTLEFGRRKGLCIWFNDLEEKSGPVAELKPHGLRSHSVKVSFGPFSGGVLAQIATADIEDIHLARSLVKSATGAAEIEVKEQTLDDWLVEDGAFEISAEFRHLACHPDSDEAIARTCSEVIVPLMAALAELIGYDTVEDPLVADPPDVEGALSHEIVCKRERNPRNRLLCLRIHGHVCKACGFEPTSLYGAAGNIIEVHHLEPVSMLIEPRAYDPETDLVPLCPNCHRAVHSRRPWPLSLEELACEMGA
jgi:5-methylcytosine-specific restriction protein A